MRLFCRPDMGAANMRKPSSSEEQRLKSERFTEERRKTL
jgi:hypothetical protein